MRPQTLGLIVASAVTAVFMGAVGLVALWHYMPEPDHPNQNPFFGNVNQGGPNFVFNDVQLDFPGQPNADPIPAQELPKVRGEVVAAEKYVLSAPRTHANLTIFLIHGEDKLKDQKIMTLQEGLEQNLVVVHDRGTLFVDNRANVPVFIQAGDIVKGGNQDRTLPFDMLISPNTNQTKVDAFCVEEHRSFPRGNEISSSFQVSSEQLPGRKFRLATLSGPQQAQAQVWANVKSLQSNLAQNVGGSVKAPVSESSLQLTLEHPRVLGAVHQYVAELGNITEGKKDAIGYVVVVNGKIQSADVYASSALFHQVWPKLLKAGAVEALGERRPGAAAAVPDADSVHAFLQDAQAGPAVRVPNGNRGVIIRQETAQHLLHDTCDPARGNLVLHRSYLAK